MLEVKDLYANYGAEDVIKDLNFKTKKGEILCILGPNGCGKTTLLKSIARITAYRGEIKLEGRDISAFPRKDLAKKIAVMGQNARIFFPYSVRETVAMGRYAYTEGLLKNLSAVDNNIIDETIKKLDLWNIRDRMIDELSGGQLQRVFLAKIIAQNPELVLLDEPTNHLDLKNQIELLSFLKSWVKEHNKTLIGVFHDLNLVHHFGDTALLMNDGKIAISGKVRETLNGEPLRRIYGLDIRGFMLESLKKWEAGQ